MITIHNIVSGDSKSFENKTAIREFVATQDHPEFWRSWEHLPEDPVVAEPDLEAEQWPE